MVSAVVLLGEPKRWESALQILVDVLRSDGRPNQVPASSSSCRQLPVVACNMDLQFQHSAAMPRCCHFRYCFALARGMSRRTMGVYFPGYHSGRCHDSSCRLMNRLCRDTVSKLEMWANAQRDGRPAEHRWRPLFNAAKFGSRSLLDCRAVTLPRRGSR